MDIRWDEVVIARAAPAPAAPHREPLRPEADRAQPPVVIRARLYGALSKHVVEQPLVLHLPPTFALRDLLGALRERCGDAFMERVVSKEGDKLGFCRVFVDGRPLDDLDAPARAAGSGPSAVDVILVMGIEGG